MPYTVSQVLGADPDSLLAASAEAKNSADRVDAQIVKARSQFFDLRADWTGAASNAAQKQGREMLEDQAEYRGDSEAAERIEFDPPEEEEREVGDDPGEPDDPVDEYEEALRDAGLPDGPSDGFYRE